MFADNNSEIILCSVALGLAIIISIVIFEALSVKSVSSQSTTPSTSTTSRISNGIYYILLILAVLQLVICNLEAIAFVNFDGEPRDGINTYFMFDEQYKWVIHFIVFGCNIAALQVTLGWLLRVQTRFMDVVFGDNEQSNTFVDHCLRLSEMFLSMYCIGIAIIFAMVGLFHAIKIWMLILFGCNILIAFISGVYNIVPMIAAVDGNDSGITNKVICLFIMFVTIIMESVIGIMFILYIFGTNLDTLISSNYLLGDMFIIYLTCCILFGINCILIAIITNRPSNKCGCCGANPSGSIRSKRGSDRRYNALEGDFDHDLEIANV